MTVITDKLEVDSVLIFPPSPPPTRVSINALFKGCLKQVKVTQRGEKLKQGCDVTKEQTQNLAHRRVRNNQLCHIALLEFGLTCIFACRLTEITNLWCHKIPFIGKGHATGCGDNLIHQNEFLYCKSLDKKMHELNRMQPRLNSKMHISTANNIHEYNKYTVLDIKARCKESQFYSLPFRQTIQCS